jgi:electron transfer flavoprotein beta subunit
MKVAVCIKQIPDPNAPAALDPQTFRLKRDGEAVLDPGDEYGIEAGLQLTEAHGGEVVVVSMGPARAQDAVRKALAMGAASGILVNDDALPGADALLTARVLAAAIKRIGGVDLVVCATESTDGSCGVVPQAIAELLSLPLLSFASHVESDGSKLTIHRQTEDGYLVVESALPAVVSVTAGVNEPRYPSLKGIMGAKQKTVDTVAVADLGIDLAVGLTVESVDKAAERAAGEIVQESDGEGVAKIINLLETAKVI